MARFEAKKKGSPRKIPITLLIVVVALAVFSIMMFMPPQEKINMGLDIQGGVSVVMTAKTTSDEVPSSEQMEAAVAVLQNRVNALGASEATVQQQGTNQILVQIPGIDDPQAAIETIGQVGYLEFVDVGEITDEETRSMIEQGYTGVTLEPGTYEPIFTGSSITNVTIGKESDVSADYAVDLVLDSEGTAAFAEATAELAPTKGQVAIVLDGVVQSAPAVQSEIPNGRVQITGNYTLEEAQSLVTILQSGSLPVTLEYSQSQVVGPTLGQDSLFAGLISALVGLIVVILYLLFYYRGMGILTAGAMLVFAILYLGLLATLSAMDLFSLSLAGIAGIVLTIGMAADSSILVIERFREEIRMGRTIKASSKSGVHHGIMTSIDADVVTLITALALFILAAGSVKGFGLTLALGIACDIVTMLCFKGPIIRLLAPRVMQMHPGFWGLKGDVEEAEANGDVVIKIDDGPSPREKKKAEKEAARAAKADRAAWAAEKKAAKEKAAKEKAEKEAAEAAAKAAAEGEEIAEAAADAVEAEAADMAESITEDVANVADDAVEAAEEAVGDAADAVEDAIEDIPADEGGDAAGEGEDVKGGDQDA